MSQVISIVSLDNNYHITVQDHGNGITAHVKLEDSSTILIKGKDGTLEEIEMWLQSFKSRLTYAMLDFKDRQEKEELNDSVQR